MIFQFRLFIFLIYLILFFSCYSNKEDQSASKIDIYNCYDFKFSNLNLNFTLHNNTIEGSNKMYFDATCFLDTIYIDLVEDLYVDSVLFNNLQIEFYREKNKIFIIKDVFKPSSFTIEVFYNGAPILAQNPPWSGGIVIDKDKDNLPWIGMACQKESGAIWFPSKHDLSDEPDSMRINLSVPEPFSAISNGTLINVKEDPSNHHHHIFEWFVQNPINNYNVTFNIANYTNFKDTLIGAEGTLGIDYYVLPDHVILAKEHFNQVKPMLHVFEHLFGPYPFYKDGYKLVETSYLGMEHQSCISYGNQFMKGYLGSFPDTIDFDFIIIHETAHEWWGNSLTMENKKDMWIHESFATYSEALYVELIYGYDAMLQYLNYQKNNILNKEAVVSELHNTTDMYYKGSWILHTLRTLVNDDDRWYQILKGLQLNFKHQIVNTEIVIKYIEKIYGNNLSYFFNQYLFQEKIPVFEYSFIETDNSIQLAFKWDDIVDDFNMPLLVKLNHEEYTWIYPTNEWTSIELENIELHEFQVAEDLFLIKTRKIK
tara:strand:- start:861 stop:2480 length:1620 start_codon:yes stop_codon:yes gene_type:complete